MADIDMGDHPRWMKLALEQAELAAQQREVPVGAVIVWQGKVVGRGFNQRIGSSDPTAHAEVVALRNASDTQGDWRLEEATLFVTSQPCLMCFAASVQARLQRIVYGCDNPKHPSQLKELYSSWPNACPVQGGVLAEASAKMLSDFFTALRDDQA